MYSGYKARRKLEVHSVVHSSRGHGLAVSLAMIGEISTSCLLSHLQLLRGLMSFHTLADTQHLLAQLNSLESQDNAGLLLQLGP